MVGALGVDIDRLFTVVFAIGAMLAGLAGAMPADAAVEVGMASRSSSSPSSSSHRGIGSVRGALAGALLVGLVETYGRSFLPLAMRAALDRRRPQHRRLHRQIAISC